jgi:tRNA modification GTPase
MNNDTICAISTAPGQGAIAIVRVSGKNALAACNAIFKAKNNSRDVLSQNGQTVIFGNIVNQKEETVDEVLLTVFRNPHSYTGEDSVEISCHGSAFIQQNILQLLIKCRSVA